MDSHADFQGDTLTDLLRKFWQARLSILIGCALGALAGSVLALTLQPHYEAHIIIGPVSDGDRNDLLASFETGRATDIRTHDTPQVPAEFIRFEQVLRETTAANILGKYEGVLDQVGEDRFFRFSPTKPLNSAQLAEYLRRHVRIEPIGITTSRRITYQHPDPEFAARMLKHLHTIADETIRQKTNAETQERIGWLQKELHQVGNPDHRQALASLLMAQERRRMLVAMDQPYAAEIIEPAAVDVKPSWPSIPLLAVIALLIGGMAGFAIFSFRKQSSPQ